MAENSKIEWTDHTFSPWRGCTKVAAGCTNCYAESMSKRNPAVLGIWGENGTRPVASEAYWRKPLKWAKDARKGLAVVPVQGRGGMEYRPRRPRVFCASLADVFEDRPELEAPRERLANLIDVTPELDWLLLTKRPENAEAMLEDCGLIDDEGYAHNVWLGVSVAEQKDADRNIPLLLKIPAAVRFVSYEPVVGGVDWERWVRRVPGHSTPMQRRLGDHGHPARTIDWIIVGGESGPKARPCDVAWIRSAVQQCKAAGVPVFVKQLGAYVTWDVTTSPPDEVWPTVREMDFDEDKAEIRLRLQNRKGGDPAEWPEDLRVREFPR